MGLNINKKLYQKLLGYCEKMKESGFNNEEGAVFFNLTLIKLDIKDILNATKLLDKKLNKEHELYSEILESLYLREKSLNKSIEQEDSKTDILTILKERQEYLKSVNEDSRHFLSVLIKNNKKDECSFIVSEIKSTLKLVVNVERIIGNIIDTNKCFKPHSFDGKYQTKITKEMIETTKKNTDKEFNKN